jgi:hypothetical protein
MNKVVFLIERLDPVLEHYGKLQGLHEYKYCVYYDVVDSMATSAAQSGRNTEERERQVVALKQAINRVIGELAIVARKHRGEIYCTRGDVTSYDDGKYIFISGKWALRYLNDCVERLVLLTKSFTDVRLRLYVVPCNFVRSAAFRYQNAPEVQGLRFWASFDRLIKAGRQFEPAVKEEHSFLLVADESMYTAMALKDVDWVGVKNSVIDTKLAEVVRSIPVRFGSAVARLHRDDGSAHDGEAITSDRVV